MKLLLDTNILARAAAGPPGPAHELLLLATQHTHTLVLSPFLVSELGRVLRYDRLRPVHGLNDVEIDQYVDDLVMIADWIDPKVPASAVSRDPDDDPVIAAAIAGRVQALFTLDRHLLRSDVKDYLTARGIEVLGDLDLLSRLSDR
jgi:putative PIN family toxin of toxin-antitoxin system